MNNRSQPTLFASLLASCVRFSFYASVVKTNLGRAFAFLTLIAFVSAVSFTLYVQQVILPSLDRAADKLPAISIKNGKVEVEGQTEAEVSKTIYEDPQKVLRIDLDLEGVRNKQEVISNFDYTIVITKYTIVLKRLTGQTHTLGLPYGFNLTIHKNTLGIFLQSWLWMILLLVFVGSFAGFWVVRFVQAFLLTIPGLVIWGIMRRDLTYGKLLTICIYALSPASLLAILILWLNAQFMLPQEVMEYQWAVFFLVAVEYVLGGIIAVQSPRELTKANEKTLTERMF